MPKPPPVVYWLVALTVSGAGMLGFALAVRRIPPDPIKPAVQDVAFEQQMQRKNESIRRCYEQGHVPVLGFGFRVVCVSGQVATEDLTTGEHPQQGAK